MLFICCADALQAGAQQFEMNATRLKRKYWWQNLKVLLECWLLYNSMFVALSFVAWGYLASFCLCFHFLFIMPFFHYVSLHLVGCIF